MGGFKVLAAVPNGGNGAEDDGPVVVYSGKKGPRLRDMFVGSGDQARAFQVGVHSQPTSTQPMLVSLWAHSRCGHHPTNIGIARGHGLGGDNSGS